VEPVLHAVTHDTTVLVTNWSRGWISDQKVQNFIKNILGV